MIKMCSKQSAFTTLRLRSGFTIIELLIMIVVIGVLSVVSIISFVGVNNKAIAASLKLDLKNDVSLLKLYHVENEVYPSAIDEASKCPTAPYPDDKYCLKASSGSVLTYTGGDQHFTMTNTKNGMTYMVSEGFEEPFLVTPITAIANISGTTQITKTLTAGAVTPSGATVSYQWQSATTVNGTYTNISDATLSTYTLTTNELDKYIKVVVTGTGNYFGTITSNASAQVTKIPVTAIANISGTTQIGQTLTAGAITPSGATVSYQWQSCTTVNGTYTNISGATSSTYTLTSNEVSKYIKVVATGTGNYSGTVTSAASAQVTKIPVTGIAAISGSTVNGQTLSAGAVTPSGATVSYQWQSATTSDGTYTNISGATSSVYTLNFGNIGKYIKVVATGTGNYSNSATSAASAQVTDPNWVTIGTQTWARYNLNVGTMVTGATNQSNNSVLEKYCYSNLESNCTTYGGLYQWDEAMQYVTTEAAQGICPAGSHIPSDNDWKILEMQLGMTQAQADGTGWRGTDQGTKLKPGGSSGLNVPFTGYRSVAGSFTDLSSDGLLWASTQNSSLARYRDLDSGQAGVNRVQADKLTGFSVRCLGN